MFSMNYETRYGDYKNLDTIKTGAVLDIVQDVSTVDSKNRGFDILKMHELKMAWLLQGINVYFIKPVKTMVPIEAFTGVQQIGGAKSERGCILKQNGEVVVKTIACWFLSDLVNKRPCRIPKEMLEVYEKYDFEDEFFKYHKPEVYDISDAAYSIKVSNRDIDTNGHLNNEKGAEILMDALPYDFECNHINLLYKKESYLGDTLGVCIKEIEHGYYVHLINKNNEICVVGVFENIKD